MRLKEIFILISLLLMIFCIQFPILPNNEIQTISLEEVLSIGNLDDDALFQWVGVVADKRGCIYVTDTMDYSLKKFAPTGNFLKKTGRKGQGPAEFSAPRLLDISGQRLYVTDQNIPGVQVFDENLNYLYRIPLRLPVADFKVLSDDQIAVASLSLNQAGRIVIFDKKGEALRKIHYAEKESGLMMDLVSFDFDSKGDLYLAYTFQDKVEKYNTQGKKLWSKGLLKVKQVKKEKIAEYMVPTEIVYKDVALDSTGRLFILGGSFSKNRGRDVYVLSSEGKYLTAFTLPEASHCIYIDYQDSLYSRASEGITLKKYKMNYQDK